MTSWHYDAVHYHKNPYILTSGGSRPIITPQCPCQRVKAAFTTTIRLLFDCNSTALRPFDDLHYVCSPPPRVCV